MTKLKDLAIVGSVGFIGLAIAVGLPSLIRQASLTTNRNRDVPDAMTNLERSPSNVGKTVYLRSSSAKRAEHGDPDPATQDFEEMKNGPTQLGGRPLTAADIQGRSQPRAYDVDEVDIPGGHEVIGIVVGSQPRAYLIEAVSLIQDHVINEVIAGQAISITYCDLADCTRVFTHADSSDAIDLGIGGLINAGRSDVELALMYKGKRYSQTSPGLPLQDYKFERKPWSEWLADHPDTTIFIGEMRRFSRASAQDIAL